MLSIWRLLLRNPGKERQNSAVWLVISWWMNNTRFSFWIVFRSVVMRRSFSFWVSIAPRVVNFYGFIFYDLRKRFCQPSRIGSMSSESRPFLFVGRGSQPVVDNSPRRRKHSILTDTPYRLSLISSFRFSEYELLWPSKEMLWCRTPSTTRKWRLPHAPCFFLRSAYGLIVQFSRLVSSDIFLQWIE